MIDVVANHVGPVGYDYSSIVPFNQSSHYHNCNSCPVQCTIQNYVVCKIMIILINFLTFYILVFYR